MQRVGFIGLGNMGLPMAQNLLKAGFPLIVHNRTKQKAEPLLQQGAKWGANPAEVAADADVVVTMVSNDEVLKEIVEGEKGLLAAPKHTIHISMSSISPTLSDALELLHQKQGIQFLAAPVSGRPERAKEGSLWIFLAGEEGAKKTVEPLLKAMSGKVYDLGSRPSLASLFKLCSNFMILGLIELFAEATTLLEKKGIPIEVAAEVWGSSFFDAPIFHNYTPMLCNNAFKDGGFALNLGFKDMRLLHTAADQATVPMPILDTLHEKLYASMNLGRGLYDWSGIALITRALAGLKSDF